MNQESLAPTFAPKTSRWPTVVALLVALLFVIVPLAISPSLPSCIRDGVRANPNNPEAKADGRIRMALSTPSCIAAFLNQNTGGIVAVFTMVLAVVAILQRRTMLEQEQRMAEQIATMHGQARSQAKGFQESLAVARKTADAARDAAAAAQGTLLATKDTRERQLRAYLSIKPEIVNHQKEAAARAFTFRANLVNKGQTPAYHLRTSEAARVMGARLPEDMPHALTKSADYFSPGADIELTVEEPVRVPLGDLEGNPMGTANRLYFFGAVEYEDAFHKGWRLRYCYYVRWDSRSGTPTLLTADRWNDEKPLDDKEPRHDQTRERTRGLGH